MAHGVNAQASAPAETDAVVIGAGPVGLFQVFELGLLEIRSHVIDGLPHIGGQCIELYADKPIYDIPALPRCTGRELIERLHRQIAPFDAPFHLGHEVRSLQSQSDGRFLVESASGARWLAPVVIVAGGVGSFQPRRLKIDGLLAFEGTQLLYRAGDDAARCAGQHVVIVGDDDGALAQAIRLAQAGPSQAASVTLVHRRDEFRAEPGAIATLRQMRESGAIEFVAAQAVAIEQYGGRLTGVVVQLSADGAQRTLPLDTLMVLTGLSPKLGPIADWGLAMERKQITVDTATFETSVPGIFAVGDVNTYPGKKKLILSGFHEAALAAFGAAARLHPERPMALEYTTSSARLHRVLKVGPDAGS